MRRMIGLLMMVGVGCGGDKAVDPNEVPVANAGTDITDQNIGDTISLDGNKSADPEGETLSYSWMSISNVENLEGGEVVRTTAQLTGATTATPHFVPTEAGVYLFSLTVNDGNHDGLADTVAVYVSGPNFNMSSSAFSHNDDIPAYYTCDGEDLSPPLAWSGVPEGTLSLTLIVDDPDAPDPEAPTMTWVHWVLYNIPSGTTSLSEGITGLPGSTREGLNNWKRTGYGGPCPPVGRHRYFHKLYALDIVLPEMGEATKAQVEDTMQGHILAQTELIGTYQRAE